MSHEIKIIIEDEKLWKAICGQSALSGQPVSDICLDMVERGTLSICKACMEDPGILRIIDRSDKLKTPFKDICTYVEASK
jgi:hypothetical protein